MKTFLKKNNWASAGIERGWGNGYVALPRRHPYFGLGYDEINDKIGRFVHGGLTFSKNSDNIKEWEEVEDMEDMWVVGWDTAHYGDTKDNWPKERVLEENETLSIVLVKVWNEDVKRQLSEIDFFLNKLQNDLNQYNL